MIVLLDIPNALLAELAARNPADLNYLIVTVLREGLKTIPAGSSQVYTPVPTQAHTPASTQKTPNAPNIPAEPGTVSAVTDQMIEDELDRVDWIDNAKRTGWFAPLEETPIPVRAALVNKFMMTTAKSIRIGGHNYTRFGEKGELIGKFSVKGGAAIQ